MEAKADRRRLLSKFDAWNPDLQAIVINGTKTHNPDYSLVRSFAEKILNPATLNFDLYRDLIQREILKLEGIPNLWKTESYIGNKRHIYFVKFAALAGIRIGRIRISTRRFQFTSTTWTTSRHLKLD